MTPGSRIRAAREAKGLTQLQLAEKIGNISKNGLSLWENNKNRPDFDKLIKLCEILNVSADEILGLKIDSNRPTLEEVERN